MALARRDRDRPPRSSPSRSAYRPDTVSSVTQKGRDRGAVQRPDAGQTILAQQAAAHEHGVVARRGSRPQQHGVGQLLIQRRALGVERVERVAIARERDARHRPPSARTRSQATSGSTSSSTVEMSASAARTRSEETLPPPSAITSRAAGVAQQPAHELLLGRPERLPRRAARTRGRPSDRSAPPAARRCRAASLRAPAASSAATVDLPAPMKPIRTSARRGACATCATRSAPRRRGRPAGRRRCGRRRTSAGRRRRARARPSPRPTTPAAGTVQESVRSRSACAGSWVAVSTERSGLVSVGSGFIAPRTISGSPLVMPPSSPPARLVSR